jgi:HSP20 family protein
VLVDETPQATFSRQLFLGDNLDAARLEASFDQGILTLTIPVAGQAKLRRIEIGVRSGSPQQVRPSGGEQASAAEQPGEGTS